MPPSGTSGRRFWFFGQKGRKVLKVSVAQGFVDFFARFFGRTLRIDCVFPKSIAPRG
jgi:hypothetical protein